MECQIIETVRVFVESFTENFLSYVSLIRPGVRWTLAYMVFVSWMYLFHAPFRVHGNQMDWYSLLTKVLQAWFGIVLLFFHASPKFFQSRQEEALNLNSGSSGTGAAAVIFFPAFSTTSLLIIYAHMKRCEWRLKLTYGSTVTVVLLNSMLLSLFSTVHYGYCMQLHDNDWPTWARSAVSLVCPDPLTHAPFLLHVQLTAINILFMALDYQYKKMRGYDPLRGLLWCDVVNLPLDYINTVFTTATKGDWRLLEPQPRCVTKGKTSQSEKGLLSHSLVFPQQNAARSFSLSDKELKEVMTGGHPLNRPGMVPWFSTFVAGTAIQAALGSMLNFLTFDQRGVERFVRPKIFNLNFVEKVDSVQSSSTSDLAFPAAASQLSNSSGGLSASDVWFDFIGDVGDGFNSTYEMARLLAQPSLSIKNMNAKKGRMERGLRTGLKRSEGNTPRLPSTPLARSVPTKTANSFVGTASFSLEDVDLKETHDLPRASFVIIGGDLAYPNPTEENYQTRLKEPYNDALRESRQLRQLMVEHYDRVVVRDSDDADEASITMLSSSRVDTMTRCGSHKKKRSDEECIRSVPLLFAIPGNHDWLDGLVTFRRHIIEESWLGGWFMPQSSSFFILVLPYNWFVFGCDTGTTRDIDCGQRNYFLKFVKDRLNDDSCVILTCHEPSWIGEEMKLSGGVPMQPQLNKVIDAIGTRLRLRICGDIHNYSRHAPADALSEAPILVVSGGGGAFLHGARTSPIISQGTVYVRDAAFPRRNETTVLLARLVGFRIINWKFDIIVGVMCFGLIFSVLPLTMEGEHMEDVTDISHFAANVVGLTLELFLFTLNKAFVSFFVALCFFIGFFLGGHQTKNIGFRSIYALYWTCLVVLASTATLALAHMTLVYMSNKQLLLSQKDHWESMAALQFCQAADTLMNQTKLMLGEGHLISKTMQRSEVMTVGYGFMSMICYVLRASDVVENLAYLSHHIEDYKHFVRFCIKAETRELHGYVVAEHSVPKTWEIDKKHVAELKHNETKHLPPHLRQQPSRWKPIRSPGVNSEAEILEHFVVKPHRSTLN